MESVHRAWSTHFLKIFGGDSLVVPWFGLGAFSALDEVQSLVRELRSCKLCSETKKKKKRKVD